MDLYLAIPLVLVALLAAASGIAAVTRGWVLPWNRHRVRRVRLYGWGQLMVAVAVGRQAVFWWVISDPIVRSWAVLPGSGLLVAGLLVMAVSQRAGGNRQGSGTR
ncbi:hypothetical protein [Streptomyces sp. NPDC056291]|uniref:hypothetical protein n=1 Tax=Streptomyces sp. NPDC056291 TaxID=3345772 RepID=UPI0035D58F78